MPILVHTRGLVRCRRRTRLGRLTRTRGGGPLCPSPRALHEVQVGGDCNVMLLLGGHPTAHGQQHGYTIRAVDVSWIGYVARRIVTHGRVRERHGALIAAALLGPTCCVEPPPLSRWSSPLVTTALRSARATAGAARCATQAGAGEPCLRRLEAHEGGREAAGMKKADRAQMESLRDRRYRVGVNAASIVSKA